MTPKKIERQECIVLSRVCGWFSPLRNWNKGKISEWKDRKTFNIDEEKYGN